MTDEDRVRRALAYEIEPWTPDPDTLMRGGRRRALVRRGAAAGAAIAVAATMTGVALAVDRTGGGEPPVAGVLVERGPTASPTAVGIRPLTPVCRGSLPGVVSATPVWRPALTRACGSAPQRMSPVPSQPCVRRSANQTPVPLERLRCASANRVRQPTTPVPTSVPAGG